MTKFNTKHQGPPTVTNDAGGTAYAQSPQLELASLLLTSFAEDSHYRGQDDTFLKLKTLIAVCDKAFVAKAIIYARTVFGMRSITHVAASELAKHLSGEPWAKSFFEQVIYRPDDITEILAYHKLNNNKVSSAMKKGLGNAFGKFSGYSLAKYRGEGNTFTLLDAVRLCHPKPSEKNAEALKQLKEGKLKNTDTWEAVLSAAGQNAKTDADKQKAKAEAWTKLIEDGSLGYFALLRNLRNIIEQAPAAVPSAIKQLLNEQAIKKSLVLPFRFLSAFEEIKKLTSSKAQRDVSVALTKAVDISLSNIPDFPGETLVVLDTSSSMRNNGTLKSPHVIGALFAAALAKKNNCDVMTFDTTARYLNLNVADSTVTLAESLKFGGGGTNFPSIFERANKKYDRVIILSDMQGWIQRDDNPRAAFHAYKGRYKANPFVYSFDLQNYGNMQFPESHVFAVAGFSEKIFELMGHMEKDKNTLIKEISKIQLEK